MNPPAERWDIFCRVVDNYGDAGVAWRLARQLAREHGKRVRLWLDGLPALAKLCPGIDPSRDAQALDGVEVARWREGLEPPEVADVILETFGTEPPEDYVRAMAARAVKPRWINLEYLSAEDWVEGSHARPSPHPRLALTKHYFFPGFTPRTGGLLRETDLLERRDAFQASPPAQAAFWRDLLGREPPAKALRVSLFAYPGAPIEALTKALAEQSPPVWCVIPEVTVPFLPQERYDELLWACDANFVRGEDSFVRAQWAARPFVWHIYPQGEGAHWVKLSAFLARYTASLSREDAAALTALWEAWNRSGDVARAWHGFATRLQPLRSAAATWAEGLARRRDLAAELADFADNVLK